MGVRKLLVMTALVASTAFADDMGHRDFKAEFTGGKGDTIHQSFKYKLGNKVMMNLKGTQYNGVCDAVGEIWNIEDGTYYIKGVKCEWGYEDTFRAKEEEIIDVFKEEDFSDDGRFEEGGWFSRDKSKDWFPCLRNSFSEDVQEELCKKNPLMFY